MPTLDAPADVVAYLTRPVDVAANLNELARQAHDGSVAHGFYDPPPIIPQRIALMHSELSEALEADRVGNPPSEKIPAFSHLEEELADCVIRILDLAGHLGFDIGGAIVAKMKYNEGRPLRHGNKKY